MTLNTPQGTAFAPSTQAVMDAAIQQLYSHKDAWVKCSVAERVALVDTLIKDFSAIAPRWVAACAQAKGLAQNDPRASEEWGAGTWMVLHVLRQLRQALLDISHDGYPRIPGPVTTRPDGQVVAQVFPFKPSDRLFFTGVTAEVWMEPGVTTEDLPQTQAVIYQDKQHSGRVALVLGAGNVASIGPTDIIYKLFVEDQVVIFKTNPVNAYLGPLLEESFHALIDAGYMRIVYGGATEGAYLCNHPGIDTIHITGSDKTFDSIVFGPGPEGKANKAAHKPRITKPVTGELGNVSPLIVVPGPWSASDLAYQAEHIVTMLANNAGFNCNATRVIMQHAEWKQRDQLMQSIRDRLATLPPRDAYYPGAQQIHQTFVTAHPAPEQFGTTSERQLPWTLISDVNPAATTDICFSTEPFCSLFTETALSAESVATYIEQAVAFANERLWGTLSATIIVHPQSLKDPTVAAAVERAIADLRYGTIGVNYWAGVGFTLGSTPWGAFPGHDIYDIQSGNGIVHNTLMFSRAQKSVIRAPFRSFPKPSWFVTQSKIALNVFPKLVTFEARPSPWQLPSIIWSALVGR